MTELKRKNHQNSERRARPWKLAKFEKQVDIDCPNVICDLRTRSYGGESAVSQTSAIMSKIEGAFVSLANCPRTLAPSITGGGLLELP